MENRCFKLNCESKVFIKCTCTLQISSCINHIGEHLATTGSHTINIVAVTLNGQEIENQTERARKLLKYLDFLKTETQELSKNLINLIIKQSANRLENIKKLKDFIKKITLAAQRSDFIELNELSQFNSIYLEENTENLMHKRHLFNYIKKMFSLPSDKVLGKIISDKYIFYPLNYLQNIINVCDLKRNQIIKENINGFNLNPGCLCCRISPTKYFIHGGSSISNPNSFSNQGIQFTSSQYNPFSGSLFSASISKNELSSSNASNNMNQLFNVDNKRKLTSSIILDVEKWSTEEITKSQIIIDSSGCYFDNWVYIFGGKSENNVSLSESNRFCLSTKEWENLPDLPFPCVSTSSSAFDRNIWVTGFSLSNLLRFNSEKQCFDSFHDLGKDRYKYIFDNFVIVNNEFVGIIEEGKFKRTFSIKIDIGKLKMGTCFKKRGNYYFINDRDEIFKFEINSMKVTNLRFQKFVKKSNGNIL